MGETDLDNLIRKLRDFRDRRNWTQFHTSKDLAISVSIEAAELLEIFQWRSDVDATNPIDMQKISSEVADVFLYLMLLCDKLGLSLLEVANEKLLLNEKRFPVTSSHGIAKPEDITKKP